MRDAGLRISNREVRDIAPLVQTLVSGSGNREQARTHIEALRNALDSLRARTPPGRNLPPVLLAIARDFVPAPTSRQDQDRVQSRIQGDPKLGRLLG